MIRQSPAIGLMWMLTWTLFLAGGCAPTGTPALSDGALGRSDHVFRHDWTLPPGKFAEVNLHFGAGATAEAYYKSSDIVQWNVHSHPGKEAVMHQQGEGTGDTIRFRAPAEGAYSFMWQNDRSSPVTLSVELDGGMQLESYHPQD